MTQISQKPKLLTFLNQFRLEWNMRHAVTDHLDSASNTYIRLLNRIQPGWYMLAVQVETKNIKQEGAVLLTDAKGEATAYAIAFQSGRVVKRLIWANGPCGFEVDLGTHVPLDSVVSFSLKRVTQGFAKSRMLTKLYSLHALYKARRAQQKRFRFTEQDGDTRIETLWQDYCNLFDNTVDIAPYKLWVEKYDTLTDQDRLALAATIGVFSMLPVVSVLMPVYNPNVTWLAEAIDSVRTQIYPHWQLCLANDASTDPQVAEILDTYARMDSRIVVVHRKQNGHISACSNSALTLASGDWLALLDHDDLITPDALLRVVAAINERPEILLIYSDEDKIDENNSRSDPYFKCAWNQDLFYSQNMISHLGVYKTALVRQVGSFRLGFEGSQDYDLALRCIEQIAPGQIHHIPRVLYHWRIHAKSTANGLEAKPYAVVAGERALNDHLCRIGVAAEANALHAGYRVRYKLAEQPLVTLIIPTHNAVGLLRVCVESIRERTIYPHYEILIVDNGSSDPATLRYLKRLATEPSIRVIQDDRPFNYSALNNSAVKLARGEIIGLINNDVEVINGDWLDEMVSHAMRPGIGAVGAKLLYSDDTVQHAGIILGVHGIAGHAHRFARRDSVGYCGRAALIQSYSAVTAACLVVRKDLFEKVGGFNEQALAIACNDVDFCLRLGQAGHRTIWTPYAELYHHESSTRGLDDTPQKIARAASENAYMRKHWASVMDADPAYNPNLSLDSEDFSTAWPPRTLDGTQQTRAGSPCGHTR